MVSYLQPNVRLVAENGRLGLEREGVPVFHQLTVGEAVALACLGACGDATEALAICEECMPDGQAWVARVLDRYHAYLGEGAVRELDFDWISRALRMGTTRKGRPAAPASLTWLVTLGCNRHCRYCFFDVYHHPVGTRCPPPDATFPLADACRMVQQMGQIGAADLYLTGGEPLLRDDLMEIIAEASLAHVRTHLATKYPIDRKLARRLANAGLNFATVSLDDARPLIAAQLTGAKNYLTEARRSIGSLLEEQIPVEVNAVVTTGNVAHLTGLIEYCIELGVPSVKLSRFNAPYSKRASVKVLRTPESIAEIVDRLRQAYGHDIAIRTDPSSTTEDCSVGVCGHDLICEVGQQTLEVLPDGSVTRCHYIPTHAELVVGSLIHSSILDLWNSPRLLALNHPTRSAYAQTACANCDDFDGCNARGRCYLSSLVGQDRLYAPDSFCGRPKEQHPSLRVLHWCVTQYCPRSCIYCYAQPKRGTCASDSTVSRSTLKRIFTEAAKLGAKNLLVSGAEPFLRTDLPEVLGDAQRAGLLVSVTTKHPITRAVAKRLANENIGSICLSVDCLDEALSQRMIGSARYPEEVYDSVRYLREAKIEFGIQSVLCSLNHLALDQVASFAQREGARVLQVSPFEPNRRPLSNLTNDPMVLGADAARQVVSELSLRYPDLRVELFVPEGKPGTFHCDIGLTKLFMLADGVVHRCYKLVNDDNLRGPDLKAVSVAEAWHDPTYRALVSLDATDYQGTQCEGCIRFSRCQSDGRCIYEAYRRQGRYAAPDRNCET